MATKFTLIGSGLAGGMMAAFLGRRGYDVELFERRGDPHSGNLVGGRSINLALSTRGIHALEQLGIADQVLQHAIPMRGRMIHDKSGELHFTQYDRDPEKCINSIGRGALNTATIEAAQQYGSVQVHFNHACSDVDIDSATARVVNTSSDESATVSGDAIIGVDGAFSAVRRSMQRLDRFEYSQTYLPHGYKEFTIPPSADGTWRMEKHALHIWPRKSFMMIALPNPDASFTCTLFWEFEGPHSFAKVKTDDGFRRFFENEFADAVPMMPNLLTEYHENPTGSLVTIRCAPWHYRDKVALVGDAAHAVVPFYGQGMNAAFEDCVVLDECLAELPHNRAGAFAAYFARRKENTDALAALAVDNFIEMRDKTASPTFHAKKKVDHLLEGALSGFYLPLYTMVSFTRIPYAEAARRARRQDRLVGVALVAVAIVAVVLILFLLNTIIGTRVPVADHANS
ncbi:MAG: FAD-dependent monooxygenase [Chthoniobacterales bacterium]|nr:FAD-dependent monooxygenase [Chthoniobacterales bacterium]